MDNLNYNELLGGQPIQSSDIDSVYRETGLEIKQGEVALLYKGGTIIKQVDNTYRVELPQDVITFLFLPEAEKCLYENWSQYEFPEGFSEKEDNKNENL